MCVSQSISEEEQQRVLGEDKMAGFKKSSGISSPTTKKKPTKGKVSVPWKRSVWPGFSSCAVTLSYLFHLCLSPYSSLCFTFCLFPPADTEWSWQAQTAHLRHVHLLWGETTKAQAWPAWLLRERTHQESRPHVERPPREEKGKNKERNKKKIRREPDQHSRARKRLTVSNLQEKYKNLEATLKAQSEEKGQEEKGKLPESPKNAQEIWQQSVIGDYLAKFKVLPWGLTKT